MKLYEVAINRFQDDLVNVLKVMQGRADDENTQSVVPWPAINNMMRSHGYGDVNKDILEKIRDTVDPEQSLIQDITDQGIVLKTSESAPESEVDLTRDNTGGKTVSQMAHNAVKTGL